MGQDHQLTTVLKLTANKYKNITSERGILTYIQGQIFLITISKRIKFITIQDIIERKIPILNKASENTFRVYNQSGLQIQRIHADPKFKTMEYTFKYIDIMINYATS